jgi:uncharacterized membrane protein YeaQ/YmgE (transglycosylase-associated protein family)
METILWIAIGALAGLVAAFAFPAAGGIGTLSSVAVGCVAALAGALAMDAVVGDGPHVRLTISSGSSFASVGFDLAPALAAAIAAVAVLASLQRVRRRSVR